MSCLSISQNRKDTKCDFNKTCVVTGVLWGLTFLGLGAAILMWANPAFLHVSADTTHHVLKILGPCTAGVSTLSGIFAAKHFGYRDAGKTVTSDVGFCDLVSDEQNTSEKRPKWWGIIFAGLALGGCAFLLSGWVTIPSVSTPGLGCIGIPNITTAGWAFLSGGLGMFAFLMAFGPEIFYATKMNKFCSGTWSCVKALNPLQYCCKSNVGGDDEEFVLPENVEKESPATDGGLKESDGSDEPDPSLTKSTPSKNGDPKVPMRRRILEKLLVNTHHSNGL